MNEKRVKTMRWIARILSLLPILFVLAEVIFPHGGEGEVRTEEWIAVGLMFSSVIGLAIAWRWEGLGGGITVGSLLAFYAALRVMDGRFPRGPWFALVAAPGVLFLVCWWLSRHRE